MRPPGSSYVGFYVFSLIGIHSSSYLQEALFLFFSFSSPSGCWYKKFHSWSPCVEFIGFKEAFKCFRPRLCFSGKCLGHSHFMAFSSSTSVCRSEAQLYHHMWLVWMNFFLLMWIVLLSEFYLVRDENFFVGDAHFKFGLCFHTFVLEYIGSRKIVFDWLESLDYASPFLCAKVASSLYL